MVTPTANTDVARAGCVSLDGEEAPVRKWQKLADREAVLVLRICQGDFLGIRFDALILRPEGGQGVRFSREPVPEILEVHR